MRERMLTLGGASIEVWTSTMCPEIMISVGDRNRALSVADARRLADLLLAAVGELEPREVAP